MDGDEAVRHVEHIDGFWGPIYGLVIIFIVVTSIYLVAYYIELRDQRARRQSVRLSPRIHRPVRRRMNHEPNGPRDKYKKSASPLSTAK